MLFGCCGSLEQAEAAHTAGFDFLEATVVSLIPEADETAFAPILERYRALPLPVRACNVFLPGDLKLTGPAVDLARARRYVETALPRARQIGAEVVVFGSGVARMIPDGFPRDEALAQLAAFLDMVADVASAAGVTIAIEPLNRKESNVINSVAEGVALAQRVNRAPIRVLADFYHMDEEGEPLSEISRHGEWLAHIHVADTGRLAPGTGGYPYATFVEELRRIGYGGMVSVECRWRDFAAEAGPAAAFLQRVFAP
ncbi:MAG: sugar phosphate isomerase/epimerase [Caldilineaceae bacterium]|nr:sugar phosphate isomerase/epimerase [Caldilineaceae bacterium]